MEGKEHPPSSREAGLRARGNKPCWVMGGWERRQVGLHVVLGSGPRRYIIPHRGGGTGGGVLSVAIHESRGEGGSDVPLLPNKSLESRERKEKRAVTGASLAIWYQNCPMGARFKTYLRASRSVSLGRAENAQLCVWPIGSSGANQVLPPARVHAGWMHLAAFSCRKVQWAPFLESDDRLTVSAPKPAKSGVVSPFAIPTLAPPPGDGCTL